MQKPLKEIIISEKMIWCLCVLLLIALAVPMLAISSCAVPSADDFGFSAASHHAFKETGSVLAAVRAAAAETVEYWFDWQGTFSAIFLMALQPAIFSEKLYFLTTVIMLLSLTAGTVFFCRAFFGRILGLEGKACDIIAMCLWVCSTQLLPSPVQAFFWYNGSIYYVFFYGLTLAALAVGIGLVQSGGVWRVVLLCLLGFIIGGGNYVTALISAVFWAFSLALLLYQRNKAWKRLILPGLFLFAAFALSAAAPGNAVRMEITPGGCGPVEAVMRSFRCGISYSRDWIGLPVFSVLVFIAVALRPAISRSGFSFRFPGLVSVFSYCVISAMFCPPIFAVGGVGDFRLINIIYFAWLLALAINLLYWMGWYYTRIKPDAQIRGIGVASLGLSLVLLVSCWGIRAAYGDGYTSLQAAGSLASGEAQEYRASGQRRAEVLNDDSIKHAKIERFTCEPYLLYFTDIWDIPEGWENIVMAEYYGKETVTPK